MWNATCKYPCGNGSVVWIAPCKYPCSQCTVVWNASCKYPFSESSVVSNASCCCIYCYHEIKNTERESDVFPIFCRGTLLHAHLLIFGIVRWKCEIYLVLKVSR